MSWDQMFQNSREQLAQISADKDGEEMLRMVKNLNNTIAYEKANHFALITYIRDLTGPDYPYLPILDDPKLIDAIGQTGINVWNKTKSWDAVEDNSLSLEFPPPPDLFANFVKKDVHQKSLDLCDERTELCNQQARTIRDIDEKLKKTTQEFAEYKVISEDATMIGLQKSYDLSIATKELEKLKSENEALTKMLVHHVAQSSAFRRQLELTDPYNPLVQKDSDMRASVSNRAYDDFLANKSWKAVKEIGTSFLSDAERIEMSAKIKHECEIIFNEKSKEDPDEFLTET